MKSCLITLSSPVNVPLVEEEPFLGLGQVYVYVLVDAADHEYLVIVAHWLGPEELFRLLERAFHALDLTNLRVQREAVRNPAVVSAEDQNLRVIEWEATHRVAGRPVVFTVDEYDRLPPLLFQIAITI